MNAQHVDVAPVQGAEHLGPDHVIGPAGRRAPGCHVDDGVRLAHQRVHVVGGDQHRDLLLAGEPGQDSDDALLAAQVEVGERFVEQQQPGAADDGVRDHHPLLLAARQLPDPGVGVGLGVDRPQRLGGQVAPGRRGQREAEPVPVDPQRDHVAGAQRHVRVDGQLLRHVPDQPPAAAPRPGAAVQQDPAGRRGLQAEDDLQQGRLARAVGSDEPGELAGPDGEGDVAQDLPAAEPDADPLESQEVLPGLPRVTRHCLTRRCHYRCSVETLAVTALFRALTSASIQVW